MKIAFFLSRFPTLSETFILNQITGLLDRGHEVTVFARAPGRDSVLHDDVRSYNLTDQTVYYGTAFQNIPKYKIVKYLNVGYVLLNSFSNSTLSLLHTLNVFRYGKEAVRLSLFYQIDKLRKTDLMRYDIIHAHFGDMGSYAAFLKIIGMIKGKIVTTFYGWDVSSYIKKNGPKVYDELFREGDLFLCLSEEMKNRLLTIGCPAEKSRVHHLGVDLNRFKRNCKVESKRNNKIKLLTVGRLVEKKGIEYGIKAVSEVIKMQPDLEYHIAGDGPLQEKIIDLIKELNLQGQVKMLGPKSQSEVIRLIGGSDVFVAPSVTAENGDKEGTPTVLIEAQALGVPVVSTYHSGIPEVVQDGQTGFLVPERDTQLLQERLVSLIRDRTLRKEMGRAGRAHIEREFNINILNDALVDMYESL